MRWISLEGAVNVRDLGGLPAADGSVIAEKRLLRSDNLQALTPADIVRLVEEYGLTRVIDMRTDAEVTSEGPGPLRAIEEIEHVQHSVVPVWIDDPTTELVEEVLLARDDRHAGETPDDRTAAHYLGYLEDRPDSVVAALRAIADTPGAALVHCAAGKDRTGVIVAFALLAVGVDRQHVIADYAATAERIEAILARLRASQTYAVGLATRTTEQHTPRASGMARFLDVLEERHAGVQTWLAAHGFTAGDVAALRRKLLTPSPSAP